MSEETGKLAGEEALPQGSEAKDEKAFTKEHRERLAPLLAQLDAAGHSTFLDLCEMLLMFSEKTSLGMLKWDHPRVLVHIKRVRPPKAAAPKKPASKKPAPKKSAPKKRSRRG